MLLPIYSGYLALISIISYCLYASDKSKAKIVSDRADAIRYAFSLCREGDHLLLLGKGHETVQRKNGRCMPFSEKDILLSL